MMTDEQANKILESIDELKKLLESTNLIEVNEDFYKLFDALQLCDENNYSVDGLIIWTTPPIIK